VTTAPRLLLNVAAGGDVDVVARARSAVDSGLDGVGFVDSPRLFADPFVSTERVLGGAPTAFAGPCSASLGLRHPATVAAALRTLARHTERSFAVVGRGESSVANEGVAVPSLRDHVAALRSLREQLEHGPRPAALLGAASGPRTISATSAALDAVLVDVGVDGGTVARAVELAAGAQVWLFVRAVVTSSTAQAVEAAEPLLGSCAARLAAAPEWYGLGTDELAGVREVAASHDYLRHGSPGARTGSRTAADDRVRERFVLTGSPEEIATRVRPWAALGVSGVVLAGGLAGVLDRLPELSGAVRDGLGGAT